MPKQILKLVISVGASLSAGVVGSIFTSPAIPGWYAAIKKPSFNPPNWVFAPVWTFLFVLMGISLFLAWRRGFKDKAGGRVKDADMAFVLQLILNAFWSVLFFGLGSPFLALIEIVFLWLAIVITIIKFSKISASAALLLLPYILWVSFAAYLNYSIWRLNLAL